MTGTIDRFDADQYGPTGISVTVRPSIARDGKILVTDDLVSDQQIDQALDALIGDLERVRQIAKDKLAALRA